MIEELWGGPDQWLFFSDVWDSFTEISIKPLFENISSLEFQMIICLNFTEQIVLKFCACPIMDIMKAYLNYVRSFYLDEKKIMFSTFYSDSTVKQAVEAR